MKYNKSHDSYTGVDHNSSSRSSSKPTANEKLNRLKQKVQDYKKKRLNEGNNSDSGSKPRSEYNDSSSSKSRSEYQSKSGDFKPRYDASSGRIKESRLQGVFEIDSKRGKRLFTRSLVPGRKVYDEFLVHETGVEYREWNPTKSKLGAAIMKGVSQIGIMPGKTVLYLGCSTGTTCSHVSDILGPDGKLFGLDFSPRVMREFVFLCEERPNIAPIIADAFHPENYSKYLSEKVDVVFQDIAQRNQLEIFLKNCKMFLKDTGFGLLALKARSIDVTRNPKDIFAECKVLLEEAMSIVDYRDLYPLEKDHCIFIVKNK